jgi:hypothetical protein
VANSGNFVETAPRLWADDASPFGSFLAWSEWLYGRLGRRHGIALVNLAELLFTYLTEIRRQPASAVAGALWRDYQRGGRSDQPAFLRPYLPPSAPPRPRSHVNLPKRQARHQASQR